MTASARATWVVDLPLRLASKAAELRRVPGMEVATSSDRLWLKVPAGDDWLLRKLQAVADAPVLKILGQDQLVPVHGAVPVSRLPQTAWMSATTYFEPRLPVAGIPGGAISRLRLQLIRSTHERPAELLLCCVTAFIDWVTSAPETRLRDCRYAVCGAPTAQVLVYAKRLPPLPGQLFWLAGQVGIPLGFEWSPDVDCETLNAALLGSELTSGTQRPFAIWQTSTEATSTDSSWHTSDCVHVIAASSLIRTTRSSVRGISLSNSAVTDASGD